MTSWHPHLYKSSGKSNNVPQEVLEAALAQANAVQIQGLPAVLTLKHLSLLSGVPYPYLRDVISRNRNPYAFFRIAKYHGGYRNIFAPEKHLLALQRWISNKILNPLSLLSCHKSSHAYNPKSSSLECARKHLLCRWLIKIDLLHFFESITEIDIFRVFFHAGYQPLVAFEMARLCTRSVSRQSYGFTKFLRIVNRYPINERSSKKIAIPKDYTIGKYTFENIGYLPQGAPTSPILSNLRMCDIDSKINDLADKYGLMYTRYSDDMAFSTINTGFDRIKATEFLREAFLLIKDNGFSVNRSKTSIIPPSSRKIILGLLVDDKVLHLSREYKDRIRQHLFYLQKSKSAGEHAERRKFRSASAMLAHVRGLITYAQQVEPVYGNRLMLQFQEIANLHTPVSDD